MSTSSRYGRVLLTFLGTASLLCSGNALGSSIYVSAPSEVHAGSTFTAYVAASQFANNVGGFQFDLSYSPNIIALSVSEGNFLSDGGPTLFDGGTINRSTGNITSVFDVYFGTPTSPSSGTLAGINFQALGFAFPTITLDNIVLFDTSGNLLTSYSLNSSATVLVTDDPLAVIPPYTPPVLSFSGSGFTGSGGPPSPTPEPSTLILIGSAFCSLPFLRRRSRH